MDLPTDLRYTSSHEWVRVEDGIGTIGVTDFAQAQLGDVVYVELPEPGTTVVAGEPFGVIESVKAAVDLISPVSGEVIERNDALAAAPEKANASPFGDGWMLRVRLSDAGELGALLDAAAYGGMLHEH